MRTNADRRHNGKRARGHKNKRKVGRAGEKRKRGERGRWWSTTITFHPWEGKEDTETRN